MSKELRLEYAVIEVNSNEIEGRFLHLGSAQQEVTRWYAWKQDRHKAALAEAEEEKRLNSGPQSNWARMAWERGPINFGDPVPIKDREWKVWVRDVSEWRPWYE